MKKFLLLPLGLLSVSGAFATGSLPVVSDVTQIAGDATSLFSTVAVIAISIVGFGVFMSIVRKIRS